VEIRVSDYFLSNPRVTQSNFEEYWKKCENSNFDLVEEKLQLPYPTIKAAASNLTSLIGFETLTELDKLDVNVKKYEIQYAAMSYYESLIFIKLQIVCQPSSQCLARILIRSQDEIVSETIINNIFKN
jgi:hypothetical protein